MSTFENAIPVILAHEGTETNHWVCDVDDLGGETQWGISMMFIKAEKLTPQDLGLDALTFYPGSLKLVTKAACIEIYRRCWWDRYGFGAILDQTAATKCMDMAVNAGPGRSAKIAQGAVNTLTPGKLVVDGAFGPMTYGAINALDGKKFVKAFSVCQAQYYTDIAEARPANKKFLKTWLRRANWGVTP